MSLLSLLAIILKILFKSKSILKCDNCDAYYGNSGNCNGNTTNTIYYNTEINGNSKSKKKSNCNANSIGTVNEMIWLYIWLINN